MAIQFYCGRNCRALFMLLLAAFSLPAGASPAQGREAVAGTDEKRDLFAPGEARHWHVEGVIKTGTEKPKTRLEQVAYDGIAPAPEAIRVISRHKVFYLTAMNQLKGLVAVSTPSQALRFARLRTARCFCYACHPSALEIVSVDQQKLPAFADTGNGLQIKGSMYDWTPGQGDPSGYFALFSTEYYRNGGFSPAVIAPVQGGYLITRWVCVFDEPNKSVEQWREFIGRDGSYQRKVLRSILPSRDLSYMTGVLPLYIPVRL